MKEEGFFSQFKQYMKGRMRYILIPIIVLFVLFIALLLLTPGSGVGQFIYNFF